MTMKDWRRGQGRRLPGGRDQRRQPSFGSVSIEGYFDEVFSVPGLIEEIGKAAAADAFVIAGFDDTGLDAARCAATAPVVGIGEAALHIASLIAAKFSVVTTVSRSIAPIENNLVRYGLAARCRVRCVRACTRGVRLRCAAPDRSRDRACARRGWPEAIVPGSAGMTDLVHDPAKKAGVPALDGVACTVSLAESLVRIGLTTSKRNSYAPALAKPCAGELKRFAPH
jgi:allantoin racemase